MGKRTRSNKNTGKLVSVTILLVLAAVLYATNPTEIRFKTFLQERMEKQAYKQGEIAGAIVELFSESASWIVDLHTERKDYLFFSIYRVAILGEEQSFIGLANNFIKL